MTLRFPRHSCRCVLAPRILTPRLCGSFTRSFILSTGTVGKRVTGGLHAHTTYTTRTINYSGVRTFTLVGEAFGQPVANELIWDGAIPGGCQTPFRVHRTSLESVGNHRAREKIRSVRWDQFVFIGTEAVAGVA